ncbi:phosphoglucosamine mutase [Zoogloea sp.]|uniref:phosphoglucosamine mutase n=1 Tax=Zoogloea sp. TaxID=49181 RepID=UPI0025F848A6|nr:phosphoglucosamine mutase [Zoogloea sp.]MCK6392210.1 phosphoglucosamine mutase [Zoogloea sp.]
MSRRYFGTDGVRGCVGEAPITPDFCLRLGYAAGKTLVAHERLRVGEHPAVIIGKDTRISGYMLESTLEAGFSAAGVDVYLAGPLPTPAIAYLTRALRLQAGVVISASHNPFQDNGIKFFSARGTKLPDSVELEIEGRLDEPMGCEASASLGKAQRIDDARGRYVEFCKSSFPNELDLRGLKIALDCANGAAYMVAPKVFHELGAELVLVGVEPNGLNINEKVGATSPQSLRTAVLESGADLGIALDGDGDRIVMVDADGEIYDGDKLLYVIAKAASLAGKANGVVGTLMSNLGFEHAVARLGLPFARAKVGDRYVLELMHEKGWSLGGENSGHIICLDCHTTGDGIIAGLQVLAALREHGATLKEMCQDLVFYPQKLVNVPVKPGFDWSSSSSIKTAVDKATQELDGQGRVLLRPSGTEPLLRVMVEGVGEDRVSRIAHGLAEVVRAAVAAS